MIAGNHYDAVSELSRLLPKMGQSACRFNCAVSPPLN